MKGFKIACLDVLEEMNTVYRGYAAAVEARKLVMTTLINVV
jgi:hypothetical protein